MMIRTAVTPITGHGNLPIRAMQYAPLRENIGKTRFTAMCRYQEGIARRQRHRSRDTASRMVTRNMSVSPRFNPQMMVVSPISRRTLCVIEATSLSVV